MRRFGQEEHSSWIAYTDFLTTVLTLFVIIAFFCISRLRDMKAELLKLQPTEEPEKQGEITVQILEGDAYFETGRAELKLQARQRLIDLGLMFRAQLKPDEVIVVQGHTDDQPYLTSAKSNWELSGERAAAVCRVFYEEVNIPGSQLVLMGYNQFRPRVKISPYDSDYTIDKKREKNRRIEIRKLKGSSEIFTSGKF